jgi:PKD repeat protein
MKNFLPFIFFWTLLLGGVELQAQCVQSTPYTENFDGSNWIPQTNWNNSGSIPTCWSRLVPTNNYLWMAGPPSLGSLNSGPSDDHTPGNGGGYAVAEGWFTSGSNASVTHLITPPIDLSGDTLPRLLFYYHMFGSDIDLLDVRVREVGTNNWTQIHVVNSTTAASQFTSQNSAWRKHTESLANWAGDTIQIRFSAKRDVGFTWWTNSRIAIDDIRVEETPSCDQPFNVNANTIMATSAQINWSTLNSNPIAYQIQYKLGNGGASGGTVVNSTTKPTTLTGLASNSTYSVRVREICSVGDTSAWSMDDVFTTMCAMYTAPFEEDFESNDWNPGANYTIQGDLDACWLDQGSATQFWTVGPMSFSWTQTGPSGDHTTGSGQYAYNQVTTTIPSGLNPRLISPWIDLDTIANPELSFWYHGYGTGMGDFDVYIQKTGGSWTALWDTSGATHGGQNSAWSEKIINLQSYAHDTVRLRFDYTNPTGSFYTQFAIDDIKIDRTPSCPKPSNLNITAVGVYVAQLDWNSGGASNYQIRYRAVGSSAWSWTTASASQKAISMLSAQTTYEWQVRDSCGTGDVSQWVLGPRFTTNCTFYTAPYTETFSNSSTWVGPGWPDQNGKIDECWIRTDTVDYFWTGGGTVAHYFNTGPSGDHTTGNGGYAFTRSGTPFTATRNTELRTPLISLDTLQSPQLVFWYHMYGDHIDKLRVFVKPIGGTAAVLTTITGQKQNSSTAGWQKATLSLAQWENDTVQIIFKAFKDGFGSTFRAAISIDDISIDEPTVCPNPILTVSNISYSSADISWNGWAATSALEYGVQGYTFGTGTTVAVQNRAYGFTGLLPNTTYEVWVKDTCTSTLTSTWVSTTFTTLPCPAISATGSISLNGTTVTGTDMTTGSDSTHWYWGDGSSSAGSTASHTYGPTFGSFDIYQVVFNDCGSSDSVLHSVDVCDVTALQVSSTVSGLTVTFSTAGSTGTGLTYSWNFGDSGTGNGAAPSHTYSGSGSYAVSVVATNDCGDTSMYFLNLELCNPISLSFTETSNGNSFSFAATPSNLVAYSWDFGDGQNGSGANANHTYGVNGTYTVVLTATDSCGNDHVFSKDVATCEVPSGDFGFTIVSTSSSGMVVNFFANATDATAYHWYWGDGNSTKGTASNVQHTYGVISLGYTVTLILINDCGDSTTVVHKLTEAGMEEFLTHWNLYPNPVSAHLTVEFKQPISGLLTVMNLQGQHLESRDIVNENAVDLDFKSYPAGAYVLRLTTESGTVSETIVKQ